METLTLEQLIKQQIKNLNNGVVDKRVNSYVDFKSKYAILKPTVTIEIALKNGIKATIDISDYFEKEIN